MQWPFVGRGQELTSMQAWLRGGTARGVCLRGAAGAGKTRLARTFLKLAEHDAYRTVWLSGFTGTAPFPLATLRPWIAGVEDGGPDFLPLATAIRRLCLGDDHGPLVVVLDDACLVDAPSLGIVCQLADQGQIFLIATARADESLPRDLQKLVDGGEMMAMTLGSLPFDDVAMLLEGVLRGPVEEYTLRRIHALSDGNPLLLREIVGDGLERGTLDSSLGVWRLSERPVGRRIQELVRERLSALSDTEMEAFRLISIAGKLPVGLLEQELDIVPIAKLEKKGLIEIRRDGFRQDVTFSYPL